MGKASLVQARLRLQHFRCPAYTHEEAETSQMVADASADADSSSVCQDSTQTRVKLTYDDTRPAKRQRLEAPEDEDTEDTWQHADIHVRPRLTAHSSVNPHQIPSISNGSTILPLVQVDCHAPANSKEVPVNTYVPVSAGPVRITGSARLGPTYYRLGEILSIRRKPAQRILCFFANVTAVAIAHHTITFADIYTPGLPPFLTCPFFLVDEQHAAMTGTSRIVRVTAIQSGEQIQVKRVTEAQWDDIHFIAGLLFAQR
ncbi:hypothetical protein BCR37DRAFT_392788 [Protomyces lactucae-debilis]|uniref:Uncharacterized protein n=1 Tax=Protomyces lactucae-debilis TaxID=2754530 RepID=A0A1Y2FF91_PROLT|nr:uncharacterized protein BCR37DRAFT_392788 [Protomyces lactucae-debilis]ORY82582.1 hypothetical protein BCR37DRAFT_392788 [Protomyces lactucae-debilis]